MTTLALVDLDNLLGELETRDGGRGLWVPQRVGAGWTWVPDDGVDVRPEAAGDRTACVVVVAANTPTVRRHAVDAINLQRFARRVARMLGHVDPRLVALELALVLPLPQAADRALLQLLMRSPAPDATGPFGCVALVSRDIGLGTALEARLGSRWSRQPPRPSRPHVLSFFLPPNLGGHRRSHAEPPVVHAEPAQPEAAVNVLRVDTPATCAWASTQPVQRGATLPDTARLVEENPARLTQLTLTLASFRGVARWMASGAATVGDCSPADGLEFAREVLIENRHLVGVMHGSALGVGVVQVDPPGATVRTSLPTAWLLAQKVGREVFLGPTVSRLNDTGLLALAEPLSPKGWMCRVVFSARQATPRRDAAMVAEVLPDPSGEVQGWWMGSDRRTRSHCDAEGASLLVRGTVQALSQHAVLPTDARRELVLMAPRVPRVAAEHHAPRGTLCQTSAHGLPFALLALDDDLAARAEVAVVPIQSLDPDELARRGQGIGLTPETWASLRRMPILVPASMVSTVRNVTLPASPG